MTTSVTPLPDTIAVYAIISKTRKSLATLNLVPGRTVYGEQLVRDGGREYRLWDPKKSKLAAAILKGLSHVPITPGSAVLYLGAATGTTASHVSDIVGARGRVYSVEFSPRSIRELISNLSNRVNVIPILADARFPRSYKLLMEKVDVVYSDIAQPEQARILADNADAFLRDNGSILLVIKARSINSTKKPEKVFEEEINVLRQRHLNVAAVTSLEPYDRDHVMVLARR